MTMNELVSSYWTIFGGCKVAVNDEYSLGLPPNAKNVFRKL